MKVTAPWLLFSDEHLLTTTVLLQSFLIKIKGVAIGDGEGIVIVHLEAIEGYQLLVLVKVVPKPKMPPVLAYRKMYHAL